MFSPLKQVKDGASNMKSFSIAFLLLFYGISLPIFTYFITLGLPSLSVNSINSQVNAQLSQKLLVASPMGLNNWGEFKLNATIKKQPEILLIGTSKAHQLRSWMLEPYSFYNASLIGWTLNHYIDFLERLPNYYSPRIVIVDLDYFLFSENYYNGYKEERRMIYEDDYSYLAKNFSNFIKEYLNTPSIRSDLNGDKFIGINAIKNQSGFRFDGSTQLSKGWEENAEKEVLLNHGSIIFERDRLNSILLNPLDKISSIAKSKGITIIAIQFPVWQKTAEIEDQLNPESTSTWKTLQSTEFKELLKSKNIEYFDLSNEPGLNKDPKNFLDATHPSETGLAKSISLLLKTPEFRMHFPKINQASPTSSARKKLIYVEPDVNN